jgi:hypothetical protein
MFPLVTLARVTSIVTLSVFTLVNLALVRLTRLMPELGHMKWVVNGVVGAIVSAGLGIWQIVELF